MMYALNRQWRRVIYWFRHATDNGFFVAQPAFGFVMVGILAVLTIALTVYTLTTQ
jgi:hypothetical protein